MIKEMIKKEPAISFNNVYQSYKGPDNSILKGVDLTIPKSDFCVILGRSGMGKSTLLRCINGFTQPYQGTITVCGQKLERNRATLGDIRRRTAMIFQNYNLVNRLTALQNVLCGMLPTIPSHRAIFEIFTKAERDRALELLKEVGLEHLANQRADQLSGGQKQRVGIARALAQNPEIILADEPVASLDPVTSEEILGLLQDINRKNGITVVVSLHQIEYARTYGQRIIALLNGKIAIDKPAAHLLEMDINKIYGTYDNKAVERLEIVS